MFTVVFYINIYASHVIVYVMFCFVFNYWIYCFRFSAYPNKVIIKYEPSGISFNLKETTKFTIFYKASATQRWLWPSFVIRKW